MKPVMTHHLLNSSCNFVSADHRTYMFNSLGRACKPSTGRSNYQVGYHACKETHLQATPHMQLWCHCRSSMKIHPVGFLLKLDWLKKKVFCLGLTFYMPPLVLQHGKSVLPHSSPLMCRKERSTHSLSKETPKYFPPTCFGIYVSW